MGVRPSILVVDDDSKMREMLVELLELAGFEACSAGGVDEALLRLDEQPYAAVVSDIQMGPRSGYELLREILLSDPHSPARYRVVGVLQNVPEFYRAFDVTPESKMYLPPAARVSIW